MNNSIVWWLLAFSKYLPGGQVHECILFLVWFSHLVDICLVQPLLRCFSQPFNPWTDRIQTWLFTPESTICTAIPVPFLATPEMLVVPLPACSMWQLPVFYCPTFFLVSFSLLIHTGVILGREWLSLDTEKRLSVFS